MKVICEHFYNCDNTICAHINEHEHDEENCNNDEENFCYIKNKKANCTCKILRKSKIEKMYESNLY